MPKVVMHSNYRIGRRVNDTLPISSVSASGAHAER